MAYSDLQNYSLNETRKKIDRVRSAINDLQAAGDPINVSSVARQAGVSKSFIHRHAEVKTWMRDLPPLSNGTSNQLQAEHLARSAENSSLRSLTVRQKEKILQLESRLSKHIGNAMVPDEAIQSSDAVVALQVKVSELERVNLDLSRERDLLEEELRAVRTANRKLIKQLSQQ